MIGAALLGCVLSRPSSRHLSFSARRLMRRFRSAPNRPRYRRAPNSRHARVPPVRQAGVGFGRWSRRLACHFVLGTPLLLTAFLFMSLVISLCSLHILTLFLCCRARTTCKRSRSSLGLAGTRPGAEALFDFQQSGPVRGRAD
jgi:hypothetical protein